MRRAATLAAFAALSLATGLTTALAGGVGVPMDEVKIVTFKQPVSTVYVGNTVIADATLIDSKHVFVIGKTMGTTNMIALARDGSVISNDQVTVSGRRMGMVTLNRGSVQFNYSCTAAHCETQPVPGDEMTYFKDTHDAQTQHEDMATKAGALGAVASSSTPQ